MDDTDVRPTSEGTPNGPASAAPTTEQTVSVAEFAAAWRRSPYQVRVWLTRGRVEGAYKVANEWHIPARHLPQCGGKLPSAGAKGGLG